MTGTGLTGSGTGTVSRATALFSELALGHAHRRNRVFLFWWMGMVFAIPGLAYAMAEAATGQSPETGLLTAALGLVLSGVGWLAGIGPRFTRRPPRPATDFARTDQEIRIAPGVAAAVPIVMLAVVVPLVTLTSNGTSPEALPILWLLAAFPVPISAALLYSRRHLLARRDELYARWLARTSPLSAEDLDHRLPEGLGS
ncbi:hypothetical protein [Arthrobacter sp. ISL-69]|uniref:hypothetical protein n=1 Tax=Arthrobacter sp. ISL-69 TaxID=2819113 RepID=UPI001BE7F304|nr:hypothetical protein [Arthrobacter sp. ISL-69]MBT2537168.1 hypothetical protein [Arthrobacter sp. ISL-69]